jgi:superfamily II DNA/RNA helicase
MNQSSSHHSPQSARHPARRPSSQPFRGRGQFKGRSQNSSQNQFGGRRFQNQSGGGRNRTKDQVISHHRFINKATERPVPVVYVAKHKFTDFALAPELQKNIALKKYIHPTPIQDQSIPLILEGKDVIGLANTGTGKTAAFLLPLITKVVKNRRERVLIMAPTRELAVQIKDEFHSLAAGAGLQAAIAIGGTGMGKQIQDVRRNPNFLIATPGRLSDLIKQKALTMNGFTNLVLDEVDRMLDMGFVHEIRRIITLLPPNRQTLFFSATMPPEIQKLTHEFLRNPISISVKTTETAESIDQDVVHVKDSKEKFDRLRELLILPDFKRTLIFGRTKWGVERLAKNLKEYGFKVLSIHGNKTQAQRQKALVAFKTGQVNVLVATDVAARGLDISGVSHVINYDVPSTYEDYVHRIGRTGRGGQLGKALTFIEGKQ